MTVMLKISRTTIRTSRLDQLSRRITNSLFSLECFLRKKILSIEYHIYSSTGKIIQPKFFVQVMKVITLIKKSSSELFFNFDPLAKKDHLIFYLKPGKF